MATIDSVTGQPLTEAAIPGIQPGGGLGVRLELAWGRFRRFLLRLFRPGHVRRMAVRREGPTDGCPHDVIDPRDLKHYRNVCPCRFRDAPDYLLTPSPLRLARAGLPELILFSLLFAGLSVLFVGLALSVHGLFWIPVGIVAALWLFVISFFRDPERTVPADPLAVVSPADGTITDVGEVNEPDFPGGRALRIGIFLSVFNVHINRAPRTARVLGVRYFPGRFCDARMVGCEKVNEQVWIDFGEGPPGRFVRVKQIAGAVARRIVCWLRPGEQVNAGVRLGMIKFGSRTEIYLPADAVKEVLVKVGDTVKGASTVLMRVKE